MTCFLSSRKRECINQEKTSNRKARLIPHHEGISGGSAAYGCPRVIHRSEESPQGLLPAASVNNSAVKNSLGFQFNPLSHDWENTHRSATNCAARRWTPSQSPSSRAMRWSLTNTQWQTTSVCRSHYQPFAGISQRVF